MTDEYKINITQNIIIVTGLVIKQPRSQDDYSLLYTEGKK